MRLQEHRAKAVFAAAGIETPAGDLATSVTAAHSVADDLGYPVAVKAQVPVGGRGKAGGIEIVEGPAALETAVERILGMDVEGYQVESVLIEEAVEAATELYVGVTMDRAARQPVVMVSQQGGVDIETVAAETPDAIAREHVDPAYGLHAYQARNVVARAGIEGAAAQAVAGVVRTLYEVWETRDGTDAEINPLMVTPEDEVIAADAVLNVDDDALFRQQDLAGAGADTAADDLTRRAADAGLDYVGLPGSVGVVGNGAGLVMTTLDLIAAAGGKPANFLDVGGGADAERVRAALEVVLADPSVEVVLINIFGGITRGDEVAAGINEALATLEVSVPIVVRLAGTRAAAGREQLTDAVETADSFEAAVDRAVSVAGGVDR